MTALIESCILAVPIYTPQSFGSRTAPLESSPLFQPFAETTGRGILVLYSFQTEAPFYKLPYTKGTRTLRDVITNH